MSIFFKDPFVSSILEILEHVITKQKNKSLLSFDEIMNSIKYTQKEVASIYNEKYDVDTSTLFCQMLNIIGYKNKKNIDEIIVELIKNSFGTEPTEQVIENWKKCFYMNILNIIEISHFSLSNVNSLTEDNSLSEDSSSFEDNSLPDINFAYSYYYFAGDNDHCHSSSFIQDYKLLDNYQATLSAENFTQYGTTNIFLSYCWNDEKKADEIDTFFGELGISIKRDKKCIEKWGSIRNFMDSIKDSDYAILILSDAYFKSINCMYEITQLMKDENYRDRIFPVVLDTEIYQLEKRIDYIVYWEEKYDKAKQKIARIKNLENKAQLSKELHQIREISYTISEFLDIIKDMNNPAAEGISQAIYERLCDKNLLNRKNL